MLKYWELDYLYSIIIKKSSYYEPAADSLHKNRNRKTDYSKSMFNENASSTA